MSLKAGVIGAGAFGRHHARKYSEDQRVTLTGVFDPDSERAEMLAELHHVRAFETPEALVAACDVVTIASPPTTHAAMARLALDAGKHTLIEKPLAVDPIDGADLVARAAARSVVLAVGHQERLVLEAIGLLDVPERPTLIEATRAGPRSGRSADVSVTMDLMIHDVDVALALIGEAATSWDARGKRTQGAVADELRAEARFASGAEAHFFASRIAEERARSMRLVYPSGEVRVDFVAKTFENETPFALDPQFMDRPDAQDSLGANVRRFIDVILGERERVPATGNDGLAALQLAHKFDQAFL
ncbi:MAG: Gfo/Idh/MocA family protein, partial [Hyphomonadaceae bacterium]